MTNENFINEELEKYCGIDETRPHLMKPFYADGKMMATNGHVAAFTISETIDATNNINVPKDIIDSMVGFSRLFDDENFIQLHDFKMPDKEKCKECEGSGKLTTEQCYECHGHGEVEAETDYNTYEVNCASCDGSGKIKIKNSDEACSCCLGSGEVLPEKIEFFGGFINPEYLNMVLEYPGLEIAVISDQKRFPFQFLFKSSNGLNVLMMGMRG